MTEKNTSATPADNAATPGDNKGQGPDSAPNNAQASDQKGDKGQGSGEGKVTISTEEFRNLKRNDARWKSHDKRNNSSNKKDDGKVNLDGTEDPEIVEKYNSVLGENEQLKNQLRTSTIQNGVRDILNKDEFKNIPESTKKLITKKPEVLSDAEDPTEALLDIEDYIRDDLDVFQVDTNQQGDGKDDGQEGKGDSRSSDPEGHETPNVVNAGVPTPTGESELEDTSKLTGSDKSRAIIRNAMKKKRLGN